MRYGLHLAGGGAISDPVVLRDVAEAAEAEGYDTVLAGDHAILPMQIDSEWPYLEWNDGKPYFDVYTQVPWADVFSVISFVAAYTERVRVGTGVLIVPYRNPFDVARRFATIDVLSSGRLVVGCGVGWLKEEFDLLGVPYERRGKRSDEYIEAMKAMWSQDDPRFRGEFVQLEVSTNPHPQPRQKPHPPIWIGGESKAAVRRAARLGDGWHVALLTPRQRRVLLDELKREMDRLGRDLKELELTAMVEPTTTSDEDIRELERDGIEQVFLLPLSPDPVGFLREVGDFARRIGELG